MQIVAYIDPQTDGNTAVLFHPYTIGVRAMNKRKKKGNNVGLMMSIATILLLAIIFANSPRLLLKH